MGVQVVRVVPAARRLINRRAVREHPLDVMGDDSEAGLERRGRVEVNEPVPGPHQVPGLVVRGDPDEDAPLDLGGGRHLRRELNDAGHAGTLRAVAVADAVVIVRRRHQPTPSLDANASISATVCLRLSQGIMWPLCATAVTSALGFTRSRSAASAAVTTGLTSPNSSRAGGSTSCQTGSKASRWNHE